MLWCFKFMHQMHRMKETPVLFSFDIITSQEAIFVVLQKQMTAWRTHIYIYEIQS